MWIQVWDSDIAYVFYMSLLVVFMNKLSKNINKQFIQELEDLHLKRENTSDTTFPKQHLLLEENISKVGCVFSLPITRSKKDKFWNADI